MNKKVLYQDSAVFWNQAYEAAEQGWDIGYPSKPLTDYIDQINDKNIKVLIPGAGNAYEAEYMWKQGFKNLHVCDIATKPLENLKRRIPEIHDTQLLHQNFFELTGTFDLILEQTFFCAIEPSLREDYVLKMYELLQTQGQLVGVMFDDPNLFDNRPPFKGTKAEYENYFKHHFYFKTFETCYNSIKPRLGREIFINLRVK